MGDLMARPVKETVDYFPHQTHHGKTMFIIESRWGNDGYAFWFKLLEHLGAKPGMVLDCDDAPDWEFLLAKTRVDEETANSILATLATIGAIDATLWAHRVIYCQNFVDGIASAFKRRAEHLPSLNGVSAYINPDKAALMQTINGKGKERKEKGIVKETTTGKKSFSLPVWIPETSWNAFVEMRTKIKKPLTDHAKSLAVKDLEKLRDAGEDTTKVLDQSIFNSWQGLFAVKKNGQNRHEEKPSNTARAIKNLIGVHTHVAERSDLEAVGAIDVTPARLLS